MEQTRALNSLEPYLALSKSAISPRAAADLITQATSAPNTYVFAELLHTPNVQALQNSPDHSKSLKLLEIFAWGTWADYQEHASSLPPLSPQQEQKLRLLTLLTLAASNSPTSSTLTYARLASALSLSSDRDLEKLTTTAIYADLVTATLDPKHGVAIIGAVAPLRDLAPGSVPSLLSQLQLWSARCEATGVDLAAKIEEVKIAAKLREERSRRALKVVEQETEKLDSNEADGYGDGGGARKRGKKSGLGNVLSTWRNGLDGDAMDLDEGGTGPRVLPRNLRQGRDG